MERDESLFALPPPVLTGSGSVGIISVPGKRDTPLHTYRYEGIKVFRIWQNTRKLLPVFYFYVMNVIFREMCF